MTRRVSAAEADPLMFVRVSDACWEWTGQYKGKAPAFRAGEKQFSARRLVAELMGLDITRRRLALRCGNNRCVRPSHSEPLELGCSTESLFWRKVNKTGGCWIWTACKDASGYGFFSHRGRMRRSHRVSYMLTYGTIPEGGYVLHRCNNTSCVRPSHLYIGDAADNARDRTVAGRTHRSPQKLTPDDVRDIRVAVANGEKHRVIAARYGISSPLVGRISARKRWACV